MTTMTSPTTMTLTGKFQAIFRALNALGGNRWHVTETDREPSFFRRLRENAAPAIWVSDAWPYEGMLAEEFVVKLFEHGDPEFGELAALTEVTDVTFEHHDPDTIATAIVASADRLEAAFAARRAPE